MGINKYVAAGLLAAFSCFAEAVPVQAWARTLNLSTYDNAYASKLDSAGNVYVLATKQPQGSPSDFSLTKYSAVGTLLWTRTYNGPGNGGDFPRNMVIDKFNNIWVAGSAGGANFGPSDAVLLKYTPAGGLAFTRTFAGAGADSFEGISADSVGNVVVIGSTTRTATGQDLFVRKYSAAGAIAWTYFYTSPGNNRDSANGLLIDSANNVFVGGQAGPYPSFAFGVKLNGATGAVAWFKTHKPAGVNASAVGGQLDSSGNPLVVINETIVATGKASLTFIKYASANGAFVMTPKKYSAPTTFNAYCYGFERDASNNFVVLVNVGGMVGQTYQSGIRLLKFTPAGVKSWERVVTPTSVATENGSLVLDAAGNAYFVTNLTSNSVTSCRVYRYSAAGAKVWEFTPKRGAPKLDTVYTINRRASGEIYATGYGRDTFNAQSSDVVLFKITGG